MFSSPLLQAITTLFFIYLLLDIFVSSIQEYISQRRQSRGKLLRFAIDELLNDRKNKNFAYLLYQHPGIDLLRKDQKDLPSYIDSKVFAQTLVEVIAAEATIISYVQDPVTLQMTAVIHKQQDLYAAFDEGLETLRHSELRRMLTDFCEHAKNRDELVDEIAAWYTNYMDRVTGWYKRSTRRLLILVAFAVTVLLNLNFLKMASSVYRQASQSTAMKSATDAPTELPLGWSFNTSNERGRSTATTFFSNAFNSIRQDGYAYTLWGWLFSIIILSVGAPFWFDLLKKIVNVRNTGLKPSSTYNLIYAARKDL